MVKVESIKPITNAGNLRAFATITIANKIRITDLRVIQQPHQHAWVALPSRAYEKEGQRKWAAIVELLEDDLKHEVSKAVLEEFEKLDPSPTQSESW